MNTYNKDFYNYHIYIYLIQHRILVRLVPNDRRASIGCQWTIPVFGTEREIVVYNFTSYQYVTQVLRIC